MNELSSVPLHPRQPISTAPPVAVSFSGHRGEFRNLVMRGAGLELVTFGFYRFWLATDIRRHLWSYTSIDGDAPEYTGRARELLIGFLFALAILVPIYIAYFVVTIEAERYKAFASIPLFLFFYLFGQFAIYRARRYRLTRTVWRGVRFWMDGSGWAYAMRAAGWTFLTVITLGIALPWREAALERYKMRHCYYGDLQGSFEGRGSDFFMRGWHLWVWMILPFVIWIAALVMKVNSRGLAIAGGILLFAWVISLPFVYGRLKAVEWRWWISGLRFGEVSFASDLAAGALQGLYWKVIGWFLLADIFLVAYIAALVALVVGFGDAAHIAQRMQGNLVLTGATIVGYLVIIVGVNVVLRVYLLRDIWARVASSTTVYRLDAAANVAAKGDLADALGEGLAGSLDIVGF